MKKDKFLSFLGLCQKAGKIVSGDTGVISSGKKGKIYLLVIAEDISDNSYSKYKMLAQNKNIPIIKCFSKETLGNTIGKNYRAVIGITDANFANQLIKIYFPNERGKCND